jgi:uncharacterized protein (UPF0335 family)
MDFQSLIGNSNLNIDSIAHNIKNINPHEILSKFGYDSKEVSTILKGDMTPILEKNDQTQLLDYEQIMKTYGSLFNENLISYFYKKSKEKKAFSEEEMSIYNEAYNKWFDFIFKIGINFVYQADPELKDLSLLIKIKNDVFQMSKIDNINAILFIPNYNLKEKYDKQ